MEPATAPPPGHTKNHEDKAGPPRRVHLAPDTVARVLAGGFVAGICIFALWPFVRMFAIRVMYPMDLEWMEGGVLLHIQRVLDFEPLYPLPSVDYIPFAYPPFYYFVTALPAAMFGNSFLVARLVSLTALAAIGAGIFLGTRQSGTRMLPATILALVASTFILLEYFTTGAWMDLARIDTLYLALVVWGAVLLVRDPDRTSTRIASAVLFSLAFWTKQTALLFFVPASLWQLSRNRRQWLVWNATAAFCGAGVLLVAHWITDGQLWFYIRQIHQRHTFDMTQLWPRTPLLLAQRLWPLAAVALPGLWMARHRWKDLLFWWGMAAAGVLTAAIGMGTRWAHINALLPAAVFVPMATAMTWALANIPEPPGTKVRHPLFPWVDTACILAAGFFCVFHLHTRMPPERSFRQVTPTQADTRAAHRFLRLLARLPGPVLVPYHPWAAVQAGHPGHFHQHALNDIRAAGLPVPDDLVRGFAGKRWGTVIHDRHGPVFWMHWPGFARNYRRRGVIPGRRPRTYSGNPCGPVFIWEPAR